MDKTLLELMQKASSDKNMNVSDFVTEQLLKQKKRPDSPPDVTHIGHGKYRIGASQTPKLFQCKHYAAIKLTAEPIQDDNDKIQKGCLSDDLITFGLYGIDESVYAAALNRKYDKLSKREADTVKKKSHALVEFLRSGKLGSIRLDLMQTLMLGCFEDINFACHIDLVTQVGNAFKVWDFKYSTKNCKILGRHYEAQLVTGAFCLSQYLGQEVLVGGIIRTPSFAIEETKQDACGYYTSGMTIETIAEEVRKVRSGANEKSRSDFCEYCQLCDKEYRGWHENDMHQAAKKETVKEILTEIEEEVDEEIEKKKEEQVADIATPATDTLTDMLSYFQEKADKQKPQAPVEMLPNAGKVAWKTKK